MSSLPKTHYTPEEYLALERAAEYKSEYINGQIYAMSGASREHGLIALNIASDIVSQLEDTPCEAFVSDMRVKVKPTGMYTYPDLVVTGDEPQFEDKAVDILLNPTVVIEVFSPSTELYDRGAKFAHYRTIPSLKEYVLISQDKVWIEHYIRQNGDAGRWELDELRELESVLKLASIGCNIPVARIYRRINFTDDTGLSRFPTGINNQNIEP